MAHGVGAQGTQVGEGQGARAIHHGGLCAELIHLVDMPAFKTAYLDYCRYFNATKAEQKAR